MNFLRESLHYSWSTGNVLGKGTTGTVYKAVDKATGDFAAVKTISHHSLKSIQRREFETLKKLNHENVVKLLAFEDDQQGYGKVIIMELCTGGSLLNALEDPENSFGVSEEEFLTILRHLSAAIKHLRENKIIHRDLKPGNIMKFISESGQTIYKLIDFGSARELEDHQQFSSPYGTEQYLHPKLYEAFFLNCNSERNFPANVDLWSIGITLYHLATGNLPFQTYGGIRDRKSMHQIITSKKTGVISGIQKTENGSIEWSTTMPAHCKLSKSLQKLIAPLIAGLLEGDRQKSWSFERFFQEVTFILRKRLIHVFYMNRSTMLEIFLEPLEQIEQFRERILQEVSAKSPILIFNNELLETRFTSQTNAFVFPETTADAPIFLYGCDDTDLKFPKQQSLPELPVFPAKVSVENDASLAKTACNVGYECKRRIDNFTSIDFLIKKGVLQLNESIDSAIKSLFNKSQTINNFLNIIFDFDDLLQKAAKMNENEKHASIRISLNDIKLQWTTDVSENIYQLHQRLIYKKCLSEYWSLLLQSKPHRNIANASAQAQSMVQNLRDSWQLLLRNRTNRDLSFKDEQFQALEKIRLDRNGKRIVSLLHDEVKPAVVQIATSFADWYTLAENVFLKVQKLEKDVSNIERKINKFREELVELKNENAETKAKTKNKNDFLTNLKEYLKLIEQQKVAISEQLREIREVMKLMQKELDKAA